MTRMGMDPDAVEEAGRRLRAYAQQASTLADAADRSVRGLAGVWEGRDGEAFIHESWPTHRAALRNAGQSVAELGEIAIRQAADQRQVSSAPGGDVAHAPFAGGTAFGGLFSTPAPPSGALPPLGFDADYFGPAQNFMDLHVLGPFRVSDIADKLPHMGALVSGINIARDLTNPDISGSDRMVALTADGANLVGSAIRGVFPVGYLGSAAIDLWSGVAKDAMTADFSAQGLSRAWNFVTSNPAATAQVVADSVLETGRRVANALWPW